MGNRLGKIAKGMRVHRGMSLTEAAKALGITAAHLRDVEKGLEFPSDDMLERYAALYGVIPHQMALVLHYDTERMPPTIRQATLTLIEEWKKDLIELGFMAGDGSESQ